ncbi:MAG: methylated-DNA--[protein]-cysteine S-methyltransferase [Endozoicomonas sp.]
MNYEIVESPFGTLLLVSDGKALLRLEFIDLEGGFEPETDWKLQADTVLQATRKQLGEWCAGERQAFDLPLAPQGTDFQQQVWQQLRRIPFGETSTYGELAAVLGKPKAARAVGAANGKNPISLIIPCHRVNGSDGSLTGYAWGLERKKQLLEFERRTEAARSESTVN